MNMPRIEVINQDARELQQACIIHIEGCAGNVEINVSCGGEICCDFVATCGSDLGPPCNSCDQVHYVPSR